MDSVFDKLFFEEFFVVGFYVLKGYCVVGGMCVFIYNVMLLEGVKVLIDFMVEFECCYG